MNNSDGSRKILEELVLFVPEPTAIYDLRTERGVSCNQAFSELTGISPQDITRFHPAQISSLGNKPINTEHMSEWFRRVRARHSDRIKLRWHLRSLKGDLIPCQVTLKMIGAGRHLMVVCLHDLRQETQVREELQAGRLRYEMLFENSPIAMFEEDGSAMKTFLDDRPIEDFHEWLAADPSAISKAIAKIKILNVNKAVLELYGASSKAEIFTRLPDLFTPEAERSMGEMLIELYTKNRTAYQGDFASRDLSGHIFDAQVQLSIAPSSRGNWDRLYISVVDVSKRTALRKSIAKTRDMYLHMLDAFPAPIWRTDNSGTFDFFNRTWEVFFGDEAGMLRQNWTDHIHPDDLSEALEAFQNAFANRTRLHRRFRLKNNSGEYRNMIEVGEPFYHSAGEFSGYIGFCLDETNHIELQRQLTQTQKMDALGRLAGGVAHDFNNLLTSIIGFGSFASSKLTEDHPAHEDLKIMLDCASGASALTRQLLTFSRPTDAVVKRIEVNEFIRGSHRFLQRIVGESLEIVCLLADDAMHIRVDKSLLEQSLVNLALNAKDAMPNHEKFKGKLFLMTTWVNCSQSPLVGDEQGILLSVRDNGSGIRPEHLDLVFDPFFTTKEVDRGSGLGLSNVYRIITAAGGEVLVKSKLGQGTDFQLFFPRDTIRSQGPQEQAIHVDYSGNERVLLVEDDPGVRTLCQRYLTHYGYDVRSASTGESGLALARQEAFDVILTDVMMPLMDGPTMVKHVRDIQPGFPVLYMSGYTPANLKHLEQNDPLLPKPFTRESLAHELRRLLDTREEG